MCEAERKAYQFTSIQYNCNIHQTQISEAAKSIRINVFDSVSM